MPLPAASSPPRSRRPLKPALQVTPVAHDSVIPAYVQVEQDLRRLIRSGASVRVPPEIELARLYGVSRVTVRQSLQRLAAAGLIKREHGRGTTILPQAELALDLSLFRSVTDQLREAGHLGRVDMLNRSQEIPPAEVQAALRLRSREKAVMLRRLVLANGLPISINTSWFPAKLTPGLVKAELEDASVWAYLAERHKLVLARTDNKIEVVESGAAEAESLQVDYATPLIRLATCFYDRSDRPVEYSVSLWRSTQMRFSFSQRI